MITSWHESGYFPTFGPIRIIDSQKIIPNSSEMGEYIIEELMKRSLCEKSIKIVYENHTGMIYENVTSNIHVKKKTWFV